MSCKPRDWEEVDAVSTSVWGLSSVPDEDSPVVCGAGEHVVVHGADRQAVHCVVVEEHVEGLAPGVGWRG